MFAADTNATTKIYHYTSLASLAIAPIAVIAAPSGLSFTVDMAMMIVFPAHAHIGMNYVLRDYVPKFLGKGALGPVRFFQLALTGVTFVGLAVLNFTGAGITMTIKSLWAKPEKK